MTSADKLGMIVAVSVVIIFVGIGVGMSGVPQETNRPGMEQQATISRDVEVPKQIQIMPDSTNKIPSIEPNPSPAPIIDDDDVIGIAPLPSPYPRPDNPDYLREGYVLEFKKYQQQSSNIINLNPRTNSMEIIKSAIHESTDKDSDVPLDLSKLIVQAIENKRLGTIDLVKMDVGPVGLSGEMDAGHYCTILSNGVYVIKQSVDESGEKQFTLSTNGKVFAILKSVEGKTSVILAAFISGPLGDSEFGGNIIGNAPLAGNLRDYVGLDPGPIGLDPGPIGLDPGPIGQSLRLPGDAVIVVDIAEKPEIVVGNNLIINLIGNNIAIDGSESYIGSSEMSRPGMEQQAIPSRDNSQQQVPVDRDSREGETREGEFTDRVSGDRVPVNRDSSEESSEKITRAEKISDIFVTMALMDLSNLKYVEICGDGIDNNNNGFIDEPPTPPGPGVNWSKCDLAYVDLTGADLSGADLSGADFYKADLTHADLSGADLSDTLLMKSDLAGADLPYADLSNADLYHASLSYANLANADLSAADLSYANLKHADLSGADLSDTLLMKSDLANADLSAADLHKADLKHAYLPYANLANADLSAADLPYANLKHADLSNADLSGADLHKANLSGADLSYANLANADLSAADLHKADLKHADLSGADLSCSSFFISKCVSQTDLSYTNIYKADLSYADLSYANLKVSDLTYANLSGADLHKADLKHADLHKADLTGADLHKADLTGADLSCKNHPICN